MYHMQGGFRLEPLGAGTRVTMYSDSEPKGWMSALRPLLKRLGEHSYQRSLQRLKTLLEA